MCNSLMNIKKHLVMINLHFVILLSAVTGVKSKEEEEEDKTGQPCQHELISHELTCK